MLICGPFQQSIFMSVTVFLLRGCLLATGFILLACAPVPEPPAMPAASVVPPGACVEPRPQVCTMIYAPVCAQHKDGHSETHSSGCNACADDTVMRYEQGTCEDTATGGGAKKTLPQSIPKETPRP